MFSWKKILAGIVIGLLAVAVIFCIVTLVFASIHEITFVEQIKQWFNVAQKAVEEIAEETARIGMLR